ncbi:development-specific protein LVN1.2-like [Haliotis rufescens]|uniref:development-specific protein LVN1.2-like n=1 Tax=Haliotis rufescens TaxID=6454 RepID=UPI00201FAC82|nr:development-specific protein LVN1.2-like [Haliotis rufescens]
MMSRLAFTVTLALVLYYPPTMAQPREGKNCCLPRQWEGFLGGIGGLVAGGEGQVIQTISRIAFDAESRRVYAYTNSTTAKGVSSMKIIQDYNTSTMFVIDEMTRTCQKTKNTLPFNNGCVPDDAKRVFDMTIGEGSETLQVKIFAMRLQQAKTLLDIQFSVTEKQCVPVGENWTGSVNGVKMVMSMGYFGITPGVKDPSVFTPPSFCKQNTTSEVPAFHPILNYKILGV